MGIPKYQLIRAEIEARITSGEWQPGSRVPTEAELREEYGVSRATAQRTLHELAQAGLVVRYRRRGTFVAEGARQENLLRFTDVRQTGPEVPGPHIVQSAKVVPAGDAGVALPGVPDTEPVNELRRVKYSEDGQPLAVELSAVPFSLAPHLLSEDLEQLTVLHYFHRTGIPVSTSRMYVEAQVLDETTAALLETPPGEAVLRLRRLTRLTDGGLAEAMWHIMRPGLTEFFVEQSVLDLPETAVAPEVPGGS
ncbi:GntR family transcriptional regulator [Streptomyces sp. NBC_00006]|uniref:GntR family transcriptional regulator n=1 Tax=unclassified Streptomyces TaxID=2593676 RepID=UPI002255C40E|nr:MULTISPECIES: GntR family transcriptional regulator [unclassified Streptomyces]MCX5537513.1 GntR family transcriptional regulator [Streptomyces sp. NBC_00006]